MEFCDPLLVLVAFVSCCVVLVGEDAVPADPVCPAELPAPAWANAMPDASIIAISNFLFISFVAPSKFTARLAESFLRFQPTSLETVHQLERS